VLQLLSIFTGSLGFPVNITLTLLPIVIGGMLLGPAYGTALGIIFGIIVYVICATGMDAGSAMLFQANPFYCLLVCLLKGALAGFVPAALYAKTQNFRKENDKRFFLVTIAASALCPIINTGIFCIGMVTLYMDTLRLWAGGSNIITYMLLFLVGINFLIEFAINVIICPLVVRNLKNSKYFKITL